MKYYWLSRMDETHVILVLFCHGSFNSVRDRYSDLVCSVCGKIDEANALDRGIDRDCRIRSRLEFFSTDDGFLCVAPRVAELLKGVANSGLGFIPVPKTEFVIVWPTRRFPVVSPISQTREDNVIDLDAVEEDMVDGELPIKRIRCDISSSGMEFHDRCPRCRRYRESLLWPSLKSMSLSARGDFIGAPDVRFEGVYSQITWLLASEDIVERLVHEKVRGVEPLQA